MSAKDNEEEEQFEESLLSFGRQISETSAIGSIVDRHNFERKIRIQVKGNQHRPINEVEKKVVEFCCEKETPSSASSIRIITLNNKNVPQGVHLAIAVEKTKFMSKNALKKITHNLANQM